MYGKEEIIEGKQQKFQPVLSHAKKKSIDGQKIYETAPCQKAEE